MHFVEGQHQYISRIKHMQLHKDPIWTIVIVVKVLLDHQFYHWYGRHGDVFISHGVSEY
jgi:hypothetical protein